MSGIYDRGRSSRYRDDDDDDEEEYDDRPSRRSRRSSRGSSRGGGFRCPYCGTDAPPRTREKTSTAGWIMFWMLFIFLCWPLCWIGFLMKESHRECVDCGMKLG